MPRRTPLAVLLTAFLGLATPAQAEIAAKDAEVLRKVGETYSKLGAHLMEGVIRVEIRNPKPQSQEVTFLVASDGRGRLRDEVHSTTIGGMIVSDGRHTYIVNRALKQYLKREGGADSVLARLSTRGLGGSLMLRYGSIASLAASTQRLPDEAVEANGQRRDCIVLDVSFAKGAGGAQGPSTYWIDKQTHLVLRQRTIMSADQPQTGGRIEQEETISFRRAAVNPRLPDSLFVFKAPAGTKQVPEFMTEREMMASTFTGKPAIDFTLQDLKGVPHALSSLRGKTVLLDFWATWCGPCRVTMPQVDKLHKEFKDRGLEVMSINVGESADRASAYLTKNGYGFTALLDTDRQVSTQYQVNGIPTLVVIDKAGNVTDYLVGARDEKALRAALAKAGVK